MENIEDNFSLDNLAALKRPQLQKLCKNFGIKASGKNAELIERIEEHLKTGNRKDLLEECKMRDSLAVENQDVDDEPEDLSAEELQDKTDHIELVEPEIGSAKKKELVDSVVQELEKRVETIALMPEPEKQALLRSKSIIFGKDSPKTSALKRSKSLKFDKIHEKHFNRMDSIASSTKVKQQPVQKPSGLVQPKPVEKPRSSFLNRLMNSSKENNVNINKKEKPIPVLKVNDLKKPVVVKKPDPLKQAPPKKPKFDLAASLAKPLGYKPYTGKLKPVPPLPTLTVAEVNVATTAKPAPKKGFLSTLKEKSPWKTRPSAAVGHSDLSHKK